MLWVAGRRRGWHQGRFAGEGTLKRGLKGFGGQSSDQDHAGYTDSLGLSSKQLEVKGRGRMSQTNHEFGRGRPCCGLRPHAQTQPGPHHYLMILDVGAVAAMLEMQESPER